MADEAICVGKGPSTDSYLRIDRIISAAEITDVDALHPGYGFLAENSHFADICENCNIRFIGPSSKAMNALGDKALSRALAKKAGVPIPPGSEGVVESEQEAVAIAIDLLKLFLLYICQFHIFQYIYQILPGNQFPHQLESKALLIHPKQLLSDKIESIHF